MRINRNRPIDPAARKILAAADELRKIAGRLRTAALALRRNPVAEFVASCTQDVPGARESAAALFERYKLFARVNGVTCEESAVSFGKQLKRLGLVSCKSHGLKLWRDVVLTPDPIRPRTPGTTVRKRGDGAGDGEAVAADLIARALALLVETRPGGGA